MAPPPIFGLVLAGGKSSRMGVDKGTLAYHHKPQLEYMMDLLRESCEKVFVSTREGQSTMGAFATIKDRFETGGPIDGILSALTTHPGNAWLVVAVDMPNINASVLKRLIDHRDASKTATCFYNVAENFPEPLLTIWEPASLPLLLQFVKDGDVSPRRFLQLHDVRLIPVEDASLLLNINSMNEYRKYKDLNKD